MTPASSDAEPRYFATAAEFRRWLDRHAATATELLVGFHKVDSGRPSMTWPESVDEALCFGWIDGVRKRVDDHSYQIRFTPRKPTSTWSAVNVAKVEQLSAAGRMRPPGLDAYARRTAARTAVYAYEQTGAAALTADEVRAFRRNAVAWKYFEAAPPGYRKTMLHRLASAKQSTTRERRLRALIDACAAGERL